MLVRFFFVDKLQVFRFQKKIVTSIPVIAHLGILI